MIEIGIDVKPDAGRKMASMLAKAGRPLTPLQDVIGGGMQRMVQTTFNRQRDPATGRPWKKSSRGGRTLSDTGHLLQSLMAGYRISGSTVSLGSNRKYAAIHQTGGTVKAKGKYLAIPLTKAAKRAGNARRFYEQKNVPPMVARSASGNWFLAYDKRKAKGDAKFGKKKSVKMRLGGGGEGRKTGKPIPVHAGIELTHLLRKSVRLPARPYLGFAEREKQWISAQVVRFFDGIARGA